ncbi:hypothetical protein L1049_013240 [Liquidambar formosana]|uniref:Myb-like domain-containing protein n=1 Tax=Liquidambar formosana TaxID=63359 RepID=A0AAP0RJI3_LIQFO
MEETQKFNDLENFQSPGKEDIECEMEQGDSRQSRVSGSRRTRSQVAPEWTVNDALILVNEIAAVEGECLKALSSFQKWKIIAENCTALDVVRTLNQCRRKWDSLRAEYNRIKQWESQSRSESFWALESEMRKEFGLPENFDMELFNAIHDLLRAQGDRSDTDPDTDPEAEGEMLDVLAETGSKKQRRRLLPRKRRIEEKEKNNVDENETSWEEKEQMMARKLRENAELIHAILKGKLTENADYSSADSKKGEAFQTDFTRRQGDKLISCFGDLVNTLEQFCDLVRECG